MQLHICPVQVWICASCHQPAWKYTLLPKNQELAQLLECLDPDAAHVALHTLLRQFATQQSHWRWKDILAGLMPYAARLMESPPVASKKQFSSWNCHSLALASPGPEMLHASACELQNIRTTSATRVASAQHFTTDHWYDCDDCYTGEWTQASIIKQADHKSYRACSQYRFSKFGGKFIYLRKFCMNESMSFNLLYFAHPSLV